MDIFFDIRTLSLFSGFISACLFISMIYIYKKRQTYPGFKEWSFAYVLNFLGFVFLSLRNILPDFITIILANSFIVVCFVMIARGLVCFTESKQNIWMDIFPPVILFIFFCYFVYVSPNLNKRIILLSFIMIFISLRCVSINNKKVSLLLNEKNWLLTTAFFWVIISQFLRAILTISYENHRNDFMLSSTIQGISIITGSIGTILIAIGLIIITAQRLENELIKASKEIKTLSGLLPICSHCKKIRDDKGYWNQIESYLHEHSEAKFSHGICQECAEKYYPEMDLYDEDEIQE